MELCQHIQLQLKRLWVEDLFTIVFIGGANIYFKYHNNRYCLSMHRWHPYDMKLYIEDKTVILGSIWKLIAENF